MNANEDIVFFDGDFSKVPFFANQMVILGVDLDKINLDNENFFKVILILLFLADFWLSVINLKNDRRRINACSMVSEKIGGDRLVLARRLEKRSRSRFY